MKNEDIELIISKEVEFLLLDMFTNAVLEDMGRMDIKKETIPNTFEGFYNGI